MKRILIGALIALPLAFGSIAADEGEQILEECLMEADGRGYDIESDAFADRVATAILEEDEGTMMEICPNTFNKYDD
ncbi:MAG: hypothetical protein CMN76_19030 [Spirochaetaceae bacterium]|nr:hypothetical protein [Spirochaetaceae bacterium]|tara:strand:- start:106123 stop:106353 length:231 start_codon:yes stop_codon:yes gene_type:complete